MAIRGRSKPWVNIITSGGLRHGRDVPEPKQEKLGNGRIRAPLPPGRFSVGASAPGYHYQRKGPFASDGIGTELIIPLQRKPMVRGRVIAGGSPVEGARVQTVKTISAKHAMVTRGFRTRLFDGGAFAAKTDAEGRFEQPISTSMQDGEHVLLVSKEGWATAELVLQVADADVNDVEVILTRGGAIEGHVIPAVGHNAQGAVVAASNGNGIVLSARADENGRYRLDNLTPGPWQVRPRKEDEEFVMGFAADKPDGPYRGDCTVIDGRTTRHDVDARAAAATIRGQLLIDGRPGIGWTARFENRTVYGFEKAGKSVAVDRWGRFSLEAGPKAGLLFLETLAAGQPFARLSRKLDAQRLAAPFELSFATGRLTGAAPAGTELRVHVALPDDWHYNVTPWLDATGRFELVVPAGKVEVKIEERDERGYERSRPAAEVELKAGGSESVNIE